MSAAVQKWGKWTCIIIIAACFRAPTRSYSSLSARRFCGGAVRLQGQSIGHEPAPPRCSASTAQPLAAPPKWGTPPASSECGSSRRPSPSLAPRDRFCGTAGARAAPPGRGVPRRRLRPKSQQFPILRWLLRAIWPQATSQALPHPSRGPTDAGARRSQQLSPMPLLRCHEAMMRARATSSARCSRARSGSSARMRLMV
jgi:hypothetical protein